MILTLIKFFKGFLQIRISGRDRERFINLCSKKDILIWNLFTDHEFYFFNISVQGFYQLKEIANKTQVSVLICKRYGIPFLLYRYRKRKIFFAAFSVALIGIYLLSGYLWRIEVQGNQSLDEQLIVEYLENNKITYGRRLSDINIEATEQKIREHFSDVAWTSIDISGTCLTVFIKENLISAEIKKNDDIQSAVGYDLISPRDGIVDSIITRNGTPQVMAGDEVKKGDILVAGYVPIMNEAKEIDSYLLCKSDADIVLRFKDSYSKKFPLTYDRKEYTGKTVCFFMLETSQSNRFLQRLFQKNYYDIIKDEKQLKLWGNYYLPVYSNKYICQKYRYQSFTYSPTAAKEEGSKCFLQYLNNLRQKGIQITEKNVMIICKEDVCKVTGEITACEPVCSYQLTSIENTKVDKGSNDNESQ